VNACPARDLLSHLLTESLPPQERSVLETHVEHCSRCQDTLEQLTENSLLFPTGPTFTASRAPLLGMRDESSIQDGTSQGTGQCKLETPIAQEPPSLGFLAPSARPDSLGRLGRYEILEVLGQGGFGIVLRALDDALQRVVAIKVLAPGLTAAASARQRFLREARAAALVRHENVVQIYAIEEVPLPHFVMEFVPGETLQQRLDRTGAFDIGAVVTIGRQIAEGLASAHAAGLIHRDVKPGNVLIETGPRLRVKVNDFGLARAVDDASITQSGVVAGTPLYMSPEQAQGETLDPRSDLFSLGSVLYAIASGKPPFRAGNTLAVLKRVADETARPLSEVIPNGPAWLCDLIAKLHAKAPNDRIQSATEIATLLAQAEAGATPTIPGAVHPPKLRPWAGWVMAGILGLATAGLLAIALAPKNAVNHATSNAPALTVPATPADFRNALGMEFMRVPKGKFWMGGGLGVVGDQEIEIPYDFYLARYEVTQEEWEKVMGKNPSSFSRLGRSQWEVRDITDAELNRFPVESVNWFDVHSFIEKLNAKEPETEWVYRLPWEREWEYACRGGPMTDPSESAFNYYLDQPTNELRPDQANFMHENSLGRTCRVGSYLPNRLGLYDMHGNVNEWCNDTQPGLPMTHRGGCWEFESGECVAKRNGRTHVPPEDRHDSLGLRVARVPRNVDHSTEPSNIWGTPHGKSPPPGPGPGPRIDPDRAAASWVCSRGGFVRIRGGGRDIHSVAELPAEPFNLDTVDLGGQNVSDDDLIHLEGLKWVTILSLAKTRVTDDGLVHLRSLESLCVLHLGDTPINGIGFSHLASLQDLIEVWAEFTQISDDGLTQMKNLKGLRSLGIGGTKVTDAGLAQLKNLRQLADLHVDKTAITDAGLDHLATMKTLTRVNLRNTKVTSKGVETFHALQPQCLMLLDDELTSKK
jgi:eukaryotic-like serine/threonine-protein kinase